MTQHARFDPGLQPERTGLAWRRTLLSLTGAALIALRILPPVLGVWSVGVGLAGLLACALLWMLAGRRVRQTQHALLDGPDPLPDGRLLLGLTVVVAAAGAFGLLSVVLGLSEQWSR